MYKLRAVRPMINQFQKEIQNLLKERKQRAYANRVIPIVSEHSILECFRYYENVSLKVL